MNEEPKRVDRIKKKQRFKRTIWVILSILIIGGGIFTLVNGKKIFTEQTKKSKITTISSKTKGSKISESTATSQITNSNDKKTAIDTTNLTNEQVLEWIAYVIDHWEKSQNVAWSYTINPLKDLKGRDSRAIYYSVIFQNSNNSMVILRINSDGIMEFETNTVSATQNKNFVYKTLSETYKNIRLINNLTVAELTQLPKTTKEPSQSTKASEHDLDIEAINNGDFSTLVGTWKNDNGDVLVINSNGIVNGNQKITPVKNSDEISKTPYANLHPLSEGPGTALGLFKIGFKNPNGDHSDTSKPRLILAQQAGDYEANAYYYRQ